MRNVLTRLFRSKRQYPRVEVEAVEEDDLAVDAEVDNDDNATTDVGPEDEFQLNTDDDDPEPEVARSEVLTRDSDHDRWLRFERFLILGAEQRPLSKSKWTLSLESAPVIVACVDEQPARAVDAIVRISGELAPSHDRQAIFALAVVASSADQNARAIANAAIQQVCPTSADLYQFAEHMKALGLRGWGRGLRRAVADVYTHTPLEQLAYEAVKHHQQDGQGTRVRWSDRDLLRLAHPATDETDRNLLFKFMLGRAALDEVKEHERLRCIEGFLRLQQVTDPREAGRLVTEFELPLEALSDELLQSPRVWTALLPTMEVAKVVENIPRLARRKMLTPMGEIVRLVVDRLTDHESITKSREHPLRFLDARLLHASGGRGTGRSTRSRYTANQAVLDALDRAFRLAFTNVVPTGQRIYVGIDLSGSMGARPCLGSDVMTPLQAATAMAVVTAATEERLVLRGFSDDMEDIGITGHMSLHDAAATIQQMTFGATDCALPILDALHEGIEVDTFVVYTDNETQIGDVEPAKALRDYREKMGIEARLVVVGMVGDEFSLAEPEGAGMLDIVGFSPVTPAAISAFSRSQLVVTSRS